MSFEIFVGPLIGGILIGLAASLLLLFQGRIFGITGIIAGCLSTSFKEAGWRWMIVLGLITGSFFVSLIDSSYFDYTFPASTGRMVVAGLLVGFGTRLGSGCTSGHGVCGLARLSIRSIVATLMFMFTGMVTVWIMGAN